jgi:hypothetical protein
MAAGWTADQVIAQLNNIGLNINPLDVHTEKVTLPADEIPITRTYQTVTEDDPTILSDGKKVITSTIMTDTEIIGYKGGGEKTINVASIGQGANIITDSSRISGSKGPTSSKSSGGGGGSKKSTKKSSDEIERYHVVKQQLDRLSSEYDQLSAAKDRAYGPDKLKAIDNEIAKLQEQEAMQKRYLDEINRYYQ